MKSLFKNIFILHRCHTGGTPFPLCPIGCSSNYPLGKRRLGEQPYCFSSSVITCRCILFTAQELLRKVQADANRMGSYHGSSMSHFSPFLNPCAHMKLSVVLMRKSSHCDVIVYIPVKRPQMWSPDIVTLFLVT